MYDNNVLKGMDCSIISKQTLSLSEKYVQRQVLLKQALADISNPSQPYHIYSILGVCRAISRGIKIKQCF